MTSTCLLNLIFCDINLFAESDILDCDTATICDLMNFSDPPVFKMLSRSARAETRQSRKEDIKRVMHSVDKVFVKIPFLIFFDIIHSTILKCNGDLKVGNGDPVCS